jgi:diguanylate cyclase (GGDEF)-like protein
MEGFVILRPLSLLCFVFVLLTGVAAAQAQTQTRTQTQPQTQTRTQTQLQPQPQTQPLPQSQPSPAVTGTGAPLESLPQATNGEAAPDDVQDDEAADSSEAPAQPETTSAQPAIDLAAPQAVLDLRRALSESRVTDPAEPGTSWLTLRVENSAKTSVARVLIAQEPPDAALAASPPKARPLLLGVAASDPRVVIERARAFGDGAIRVIIPAQAEATLALHMAGAAVRPDANAWTESALIAHNRRAAILYGVVGGLLAAAAIFALGAAVMTGRPFAQWTAVLLAALLFADLVAAQLFDDTILTRLGGPYGLLAFALSLAMAAGIRLLDLAAPIENTYPGMGVWRDRATLLILMFGVAACLGVPGFGLVTRIIAVFGAASAAAYLAHSGRLGSPGARAMAPPATIFALVTAAAAFHMLGIFNANLVAPAVMGGLAAAGALLLALACGTGVMEVPAERLRALTTARLRPREDEGALPAHSNEQAAVAASHQGIFDLDLQNGTLNLSPEAAALMGLPAGSAILSHDQWLRHIHPEDRAVYEQAIETYRHKAGGAFRLEFRVPEIGASPRWFELRATMIGPGAEAERCLGLIADVTTRKDAEIEHAQGLRNDALTGLGNRNALVDYLEREATRLPAMALMLFDIDRFKAVHASLGSDGADAMLRAVADRLVEHFGGRGRLFRVGGDMFAVLAPVELKVMAEWGREAVAMMQAPFSAKGRAIYLPVSVGVAAGLEPGDPLDLLTRTEMAMVQAKREGGERLCLYAPPVPRPGHNKTTDFDPVVMESDLREALERGDIDVHFQPIMRMKDGGVAGFEALLRWRHRGHGSIEPETFVSHAERTSLIMPLGLLALRSAAENLARWQQFFPLDPPLFVSVNVSPRQLTEPEFKQAVEAEMKRGFAKRTLKLEITESSVMRDASTVEAVLRQMRKLGAGLAIDDFGIGHSSLSQLRRFPFDTLKIDQSFVVAAREAGGEAIIASIITLAHELKLEVVAEGVETEEDAKRLQALGCEYAQGFFFGKPLPAPEVANFIAMTYTR